MFSIRRILDATAPLNRAMISQVQDILRVQFSALNESEIASLPNKLNDPLAHQFQSRLLIAQQKKRYSARLRLNDASNRHWFLLSGFYRRG